MARAGPIRCPARAVRLAAALAVASLVAALAGAARAQGTEFVDVPGHYVPDEELVLTWDAGVDWAGRVVVLDPGDAVIYEGANVSGAGLRTEVFKPPRGPSHLVAYLFPAPGQSGDKRDQRQIPATPHIVDVPQCVSRGHPFDVAWSAPPGFAGHAGVEGGQPGPERQGPGFFVETLIAPDVAEPIVFVRESAGTEDFEQRRIEALDIAPALHAPLGDLVPLTGNQSVQVDVPTGMLVYLIARLPDGTAYHVSSPETQPASGQPLLISVPRPGEGISHFTVEARNAGECPRGRYLFGRVRQVPHIERVEDDAGASVPIRIDLDQAMNVHWIAPPDWRGRIAMRRWNGLAGAAAALEDVPAGELRAGPGRFVETTAPPGPGHAHFYLQPASESGTPLGPRRTYLLRSHFVDAPVQVEPGERFQVGGVLRPLRFASTAPVSTTLAIDNGEVVAPASVFVVADAHSALSAPPAFTGQIDAGTRGFATVSLITGGNVVDARTIAVGEHPRITAIPASIAGGASFEIAWHSAIPDASRWPVFQRIEVRDSAGNVLPTGAPRRGEDGDWVDVIPGQRTSRLTVAIVEEWERALIDPDDIPMMEFPGFGELPALDPDSLPSIREVLGRYDEREVVVRAHFVDVPETVSRSARFAVRWNAPAGFTGSAELRGPDGALVATGAERTGAGEFTEEFLAPGAAQGAEFTLGIVASGDGLRQVHDVRLVPITALSIAEIQVNQGVQRVEADASHAATLVAGRSTGVIIDFDRDGRGDVDFDVEVRTSVGSTLLAQVPGTLPDGARRAAVVLDAPVTAADSARTLTFRVTVANGGPSRATLVTFDRSAPYRVLLTPIARGTDVASIGEMLGFAPFLERVIPSADIELYPSGVMIAYGAGTDFDSALTVLSLFETLATQLALFVAENAATLPDADVPMVSVGGLPVFSFRCTVQDEVTRGVSTGCAPVYSAAGLVGMDRLFNPARDVRAQIAAQEVAHFGDLIGNGIHGPGSGHWRNPVDGAHENCNQRIGFPPGPDDGPSAPDPNAPNVVFESATPFDVVAGGEPADAQVSYLGYPDECAFDSGDVWTTINTWNRLYERLARCLDGCSFAPGDYLVVRGIARADGTARLANSYLKRGVRDASAPEPGDWSIVVRDRAGATIARQRFRPSFEVHVYGRDPSRWSSIPFERTLRVPDIAAVGGFDVEYRGKAVASVHRSKSAPRVSITAPKAGTAIGDRLRVEWSASDADGDLLVYNVFYSADGKRWLPLAGDVAGTSLESRLALAPGGEEVRVRVDVSDGLLTGSAVSGPLRVPDAAPHVVVTAPLDKRPIVQGMPVSFAAYGYDPETGRLGEKALAWHSQRDGPIGIGARIRTAKLSPGVHRVTVTATDRRGNAATASVDVEVARDSDGDRVPDVWEKAHALDPSFPDAGADPDRDGRSNLREWRDGTDPRRFDARATIGKPRRGK
jgi:hypothetical protein